jgi:hypothetical protein
VVITSCDEVEADVLLSVSGALVGSTLLVVLVLIWETEVVNGTEVSFAEVRKVVVVVLTKNVVSPQHRTSNVAAESSTHVGVKLDFELAGITQ